MNGRRRWLLLSLALLVTAAAGAETIAVSVRTGVFPGDEPAAQDPGIPDPRILELVAELLADVEEGAMDVMFGNGHIVFDIDAEDDDSPWDGALETARAGGANVLVIIDVAYETVPGGVRPRELTVTAADARTRERRPIGGVTVAELPGWDVQPPEALAIAAGGRAAQLALDEITEGASP